MQRTWCWLALAWRGICFGVLSRSLLRLLVSLDPHRSSHRRRSEHRDVTLDAASVIGNPPGTNRLPRSVAAEGCREDRPGKIIERAGTLLCAAIPERGRRVAVSARRHKILRFDFSKRSLSVN
jgi:hypothetical protein